MKKRLIITLYLIVISICTFGQVNLVPNGDFEQYTHCPDYVGQIDSCLYWFNPNTYVAGADYFNSCSSIPSYGVPGNGGGFQEAHSGNAYCMICVYGLPYFHNYREYIEVPLKIQLAANKCYHISLFVNLPDKSKNSCKDISVYFSDTIVSGITYYTNFPFNPQFNYSGTEFTNVTNWILINGDVLANGGERYLIIGNFKSDTLSTLIVVNNSASMEGAELYIDDVSLVETDLSVIIPHDTIVSPGDSIYIGGQTEIGLDDNCIWYEDGVPIDTIAGMWVKPDKNTTYILVQDVCGEIHYDTINVIISGIGVEQYSTLNNWIKVYPNPAQDEFYIEYSGDDVSKEIELELYNIYGALIKEVQVSNKNKFTVSTTDVPSGIYYYRVRLGNNVVGKDKIVIMK